MKQALSHHPFYANLYALAVGIDTYKDSRFQPLGEAENDAHLVQEALEGYGFRVLPLLGKDATRPNISSALGQMAGRALPDDLLLVYYSGHGAPFGQTACVVPYEADISQLLSVITLDQLIFTCQAAKARHVGFIFDACFSARVMGVVQKPKSSDPANKLLELRTYMALSAAAGLADDVQSMTRFVLTGLEQVVPNDITGLFTFSDLGLYVRNQMLAELGKKQIPQLGHLPGSEGGDIILAADVGLRLPAELLRNLRSDITYNQVAAINWLIDIASSDTELAPLAVEQLEYLRSDLDPRVSKAAQRYFDELEAIRLAEEERIRFEEEARLEAERREQARQGAESAESTRLEVEQQEQTRWEAESQKQAGYFHEDAQWKQTETIQGGLLGASPDYIPALKTVEQSQLALSAPKKYPNWLVLVIGVGSLAVVLAIGFLALPGVLGGEAGRTPEPTQQVDGFVSATATIIPTIDLTTMANSQQICVYEVRDNDLLSAIATKFDLYSDEGKYQYFRHIVLNERNEVLQSDPIPNPDRIETGWHLQVPVFSQGACESPGGMWLSLPVWGSIVTDTTTLEPIVMDTAVPEPTLTAGGQARVLAEMGVSNNAGWIPYIEDINEVPMALVPVGCYPMGSNSRDSYYERPMHEVCFEKPFWIDVYEVTNEQFAAFDGQAKRFSQWTEADRPRESIIWTEADAFCEKRGARLPTEAEWEYAARGPDGLLYPWGNTWNGTLAVYSPSQTANVGSKPGGASWIDAYDLSGNVIEWVADWYGTYPSERQVNPTGPESGEFRILRGGSWNTIDPFDLRAASRVGIKTLAGGPDQGFRCARSYEW